MKKCWALLLLAYCNICFGLTEVELGDDEFSVNPLAVNYLDILINDSIPTTARLTGLIFTPSTIAGTTYGFGATQGKLIFLANDSSLSEVQLSYEVTYIDQGIIYSGNANIFVNIIGGGVVNHPPVAVGEELVLTAGDSIDLDVLSNDSDEDGDSLYIANLVNDSSELSAEIVDDKIRITAAVDYVGSVNLLYRISDGIELSNEAVISIVVVAAGSDNAPPVAQDDSIETLIDQAVSVNVLQNDVDPDGDDIYLNSIISVNNGVAIIDSDRIVFTPDSGFIGIALIRYEIQDSLGLTSQADLRVLVVDNSYPVALDDYRETRSNRGLIIDVLANDADSDGDTLELLEVTSPNNADANIVDGKVIYTPFLDFVGTDNFEYRITDNKGGVASAAIQVSVLANTVPIANKDFVNTEINQSLSINVLANDSDADGDELNVITVQSPVRGGEFSYLGDGLVSFIPANNFIGTAISEYEIEDLSGARSITSISVRVHQPAELIRTLDLSLADDGLIDESILSHVYSTSDSEFISAISPGDISNDGIEDVIFTVEEGASIDGAIQDILFGLWGTTEQSLGGEILLDSMLDIGGSSSIGGQVLHIDDDKIQSAHPEGEIDLNNDGLNDQILLRDFGIVLRFGTSVPLPLVNLNEEATYFSAATTSTPIVHTAKALDFNGDGIDDIAIAVQNLDATSGAQVKIFYGPINEASSNIFLRELVSDNAVVISGFDGSSPATAPLSLNSGDVNGDGVEDLLIGGVSEVNQNGDASGLVYLLLGGQTLAINTNINILSDVDRPEGELEGALISWEGSVDESIGATLKTADFNADGIDDILIGNSYRGAPAPAHYMRALSIIYGSAHWNRELDLAAVSATPLSGSRIVANKLSGTLIRSEVIQSFIVADINGDAYSDIAIQTAGTIRVLLGGSAKRPAIVDVGQLSSSQPIVNFNLLGALPRMTKADSNGDGFDDLIVFRELSAVQDAFILYGGIEYR